MKIKIDQIRTYDDAGYRRRAACLCVRSECESEVLLVSSSRCQNLWVVPGGGLEPGEDPATTAVREVDEEAGAIGRLGRLLDVFENKERKTRTYVYILVVEKLKDDYDDKIIGRARKWFSLLEATNKLQEHKPVQSLYLEKLLQDMDHVQRSNKCLNVRLQNQYDHILLSEKESLFDAQIKDLCESCRKAYEKNVLKNYRKFYDQREDEKNLFKDPINISKEKATTDGGSSSDIIDYVANIDMSSPVLLS